MLCSPTTELGLPAPRGFPGGLLLLPLNTFDTSAAENKPRLERETKVRCFLRRKYFSYRFFSK